jgi:hypothetical protein
MTEPTTPAAAPTAEIDASLTDAGQPAPEAPADAEQAAPEPDSADTDTDTDGQGDDEPDIDTGTRAGRDAAKYRQRLRDTEAERDTITAERDQLAAQLAADRRAMIDWRASGAKLDPALLDANGLDPAAMLDADGRIDLAKVDDFVKATAARFGVGGFTPNRGQGMSGGAPAAKTPSLADAFKR